MRPGHPDLNDFELAILRSVAESNPSLLDLIPKLRVISREFTGAGSFTHFICPDRVADLANTRIGLNKLINMPGVPSGLGALLFCKEGKPDFLEIYTQSDELWDGIYTGYRLNP